MNTTKNTIATNAQSIVEYVLLTAVLITTLLVSFKYLISGGNAFENHFQTAAFYTTGEIPH